MKMRAKEKKHLHLSLIWDKVLIVETKGLQFRDKVKYYHEQILRNHMVKHGMSQNTGFQVINADLQMKVLDTED